MVIGHGVDFPKLNSDSQVLARVEVSEQFSLRLFGLMIFLAVGRCGERSGRTPKGTQGATLRFVPSFSYAVQ